MTITTKFLLGWLSVHVVVWLVTLFVIVVFGYTVPDCSGNRYLCGTPLAANIDWFEDQPDFVLLAVIELFADGFAKFGLLLAMTIRSCGTATASPACSGTCCGGSAYWPSSRLA